MSSSSAASSSSSRGSPSPEPPKSKALKRKRSQKVSKKAESSDSESDDDGDKSGGENDMEVEEEKPVVSHAERRKQKRREKQLAKEAAAAAEAEDDDEDSDQPQKKRKLKDGAKKVSAQDAASQKRQNSIWVGNLSFKTTQENLRTFFKDVGEITRIHLPTKPSSRPNLPQENRGFAYVDFATPEAKTAAIALSEQPLSGRKLLIKDGGDFAGRPIVAGAEATTTDSTLGHKTHSKTAQKILRNQKQPPGPTLFLGNLPFETTDDDIRQLFEGHRQKSAKKEAPAKKESKEAKVEDKDESEDEAKDDTKDKDASKDTKKKADDDFILKIRMGTFEDTGACKGFAFVDFSSIDNATSALINPKNHHFNGRDLKVEFAGADAIRRGAAKHLAPGYTKDKPVGGKRGDFNGDRKRNFGKPSGPRTNNYNRANDEGEAEYKEPSKTRSSWKTEGTAQQADGGDGEAEPQPRERREGGRPADKGDRRQGRETKGPRSRPKPGAALALAKRETFAIIPSEGKKITF